jgi:hypothetical protein
MWRLWIAGVFQEKEASGVKGGARFILAGTITLAGSFK